MMAAHTSTSSVDFLSDRSSPATVPAPAAETIYCFSLLAAAEPGVMPRVLELFARRGLTPTRWHSDVIGRDRQDLSIDIQVHGLDVAAGDYIARCLRQVCQVETVLTSQKHVGQR
jgi:acetolactate synthase small subunit